jgi:regulator of nonsense transcripts 2
MGELTKFGVCPQYTTFYCLKRLILDDFSRYNIDMAATVLESCGRYLINQPESHRRMRNLIETIRKKESSQGMSSSEVLTLENAIYICDHRYLEGSDDAVEKQPKSMNLRYAFYLVRHVLCDETINQVVRQLLKFDWNSSSTQMELRRALGKPWKIKFVNIRALANALKCISAFYPSFVVNLVEEVVEEVRWCLDSSQMKYNQHILACVRFLGELGGDQPLVSQNMLLMLLQFLVLYGQEEGIPLFNVPNALDPPDNTLRIRAICSLLECMSVNHDVEAKEQIDSFVLLFEYYLATKGKLPADVEFLVQEALALLNITPSAPRDIARCARRLAKSQISGSFGKKLEEIAIAAESNQVTGNDPAFSGPQPELATESELANLHIHSAAQKHDEFDRALSGMISSGYDERRWEGLKGAFDSPIPVGLISKSAAGTSSMRGNRKISAEADDNSPKGALSTGEAGTLKLLVKKKNKAVVRELELPVDRSTVK